MSLHVWWMFLLTVFVLSGTPGPNMLHVMTRSVQFGVRRSLLAMAGCLLAVVLVLLASAAGLGAVLDASPRVFEVLRYAGVGYLLWLGIAAWRSGEAPLDPQGAPSLAASLSPLQLFRGGLAIGLSNPKLLLFAAAFLPQFVDKDPAAVAAVRDPGGHLRRVRVVLVRGLRHRRARHPPLPVPARPASAVRPRRRHHLHRLRHRAVALPAAVARRTAATDGNAAARRRSRRQAGTPFTPARPLRRPVWPQLQAIHA